MYFPLLTVRQTGAITGAAASQSTQQAKQIPGEETPERKIRSYKRKR